MVFMLVVIVRVPNGIGKWPGMYLHRSSGDIWRGIEVAAILFNAADAVKANNERKCELNRWLYYSTTGNNRSMWRGRRLAMRAARREK